MACVFCAIRDGGIPSVKVAETGEALVVLDIFPEARGHSLVVPKKHYLKPADIPEQEFHGLMDLVVRVQEAVVKSGLGQGTNIVQNYWPYIPQGEYKVDHVHFHVIPRNPGDSLEKKKAEGAELEEAAELLKKNL